MEVWVTRTLTGIAPTDEDARRAFDKHGLGTTFPIDVPVRVSRSGKWHNMYWVLMTLLGNNLDRIEVEPGLVLPIRNKDDAHVAMKYATGLFDSYAIEGGVVRLLKSTAFDSMTPDEWESYWKRVMDAVHAKFLPGIDGSALQDEIAKIAS